MEYKLISGDSHIDLTWMPGNVFLENAPAQYRGRRAASGRDGLGAALDR